MSSETPVINTVPRDDNKIADANNNDIRHILEKPQFKEYSVTLHNDLSPKRPLATIFDKFTDLELALFVKYYSIVDILKKDRGAFMDIIFNDNLQDPLLPGFRKMNFFMCLQRDDSELTARQMNITEICGCELVKKSPEETKVLTSVDTFVDHAKLRVRREFRATFETQLMEDLPHNFGGQVVKKQRDDSERIGTALMMRRIADWEAHDKDLSKTPLPDYDEEHRQEFRDALFLVLIDKILAKPRTMKELITYFLLVEVITVDFKLYQQKIKDVWGKQKNKRPSKRPVKKETRSEFIERKRQEAIANGDILSEYYEKPVEVSASSKVFAFPGGGTLTLDDIEKKIYDDKPTTFVRQLTQEQIDEQEAILEQVRQEKIKKREEEKKKKETPKETEPEKKKVVLMNGTIPKPPKGKGKK